MRSRGDNLAARDSEEISAIGGEAHCTPEPPPPRRQQPRLDDQGRLISGRLAGFSLWQAIWVLSWPILVESFLNSLVGLVDTILAAGLSEAATDAIGGASYILWFLSLIGLSVGIGATALVSRAVGGGKQAVANAALGQALLLSTVMGALVGVVVFAGAPLIAAALINVREGAGAEAGAYLDQARGSMIVYLRWAAAAVPMNSIMLTGLACCRAAGDAYRPLWTMLIVNGVNILVSWALAGVDLARTRLNDAGEAVSTTLVANPFPFNLGITGIAIGTFCAWTIGAVIVTGWLVSGTSGVRLRRRRLVPHWHTMRRLVRVGLPSFVESTGMWFGNFLILLLVGAFQIPGYLGAHIIAIRVEAFSFLPGFSMGMAAATLMGQYLGAGSESMARKAATACTLIACAFMGTMGLCFIFFSRNIVGIMSQQEAHLELAPQLLFMTGFIQIPFAIGLALRTGMRGAGDSKVVMFITWFSTYALRLPMAWFFSGIEVPLGGGLHLPNPGPDWGLVGIWVGLLAELVIRGALFLARFLHGGWARTTV